jgi:hypothetical protein
MIKPAVGVAPELGFLCSIRPPERCVVVDTWEVFDSPALSVIFIELPKSEFSIGNSSKPATGNSGSTY